MDSTDDLELEGNDAARGKSGHGVRKNISIKLKNGGKSGKVPGRAVRRSTRSSSSRSTPKPKKRSPSPPPPPPEKPVSAHVEMDDDIIEDIEFSTMKVTGVEPTHKMQKLIWDQKMNVQGIKVIDPIIHTCETCDLPILLYGRMIPCKHVFCYDCAKKKDKLCTRCGDPVSRVEKSALGAVFVCTFGGLKHGASGCRRTYLSHRDLQAHINYRHLKQQNEQHSKSAPSVQTAVTVQPPNVAGVSITPQPTGPQTSPYSLAHASPMLSPNMPMVQQQPTHQPVSLQPLQQAPLQQAPMQQAPMQQAQPHHDPNMIFQQQSHGQQAVNPQMHPSITPPLNQQVPQTHVAPPPQTHMAPQQQTHGPPPQLQMVPPPAANQVDSFQSIPVMTNRVSNLITLTIQDEEDYPQRDGTQYPPSTGAPQYMHPPPSQPMITNPQPPTHYNTSSHQPPMSSYSPGNLPQSQGMPPTSRPPPSTSMINPRPPLLSSPMNLPPHNLSQPPPNGPMGVPSQPRPTNTVVNQPMMGGRYPNNPAPQNMYNQPPPNSTRTWQGGPPQTGHMGGPPPQGPPPQGHPQQGPPPQGHSQQGHPQGPPPQRGPPQQGPPQRGPPQQGPPQRGPPQQGPPQRGPPQQGPPQRGPPQRGPPQQGPPPRGPRQGPPPRGPPSNSNMGPPPSSRSFYQ